LILKSIFADMKECLFFASGCVDLATRKKLLGMLKRNPTEEEQAESRSVSQLPRIFQELLFYQKELRTVADLEVAPAAFGSCSLCSGNFIAPFEIRCCKSKFCVVCLCAALFLQRSCPHCQIDLAPHSLHGKFVEISSETQMELVEPQQDEQLTFETWKISLMKTWKCGSKLQAILCFLYELVTSVDVAKALVFSRDSKLLDRIYDILTSSWPEVFSDMIVTVKGNVYTKEKVLNSFTSLEAGSPRLLFLSSEKNASGTHLVAASHIVMIDPVLGTRAQAQATDAQAIARAHRLGQDQPVRVVRFIAANTLDQSDYENAYGAINPSLISKVIEPL